MTNPLGRVVRAARAAIGRTAARAQQPVAAPAAVDPELLELLAQHAAGPTARVAVLAPQGSPLAAAARDRLTGATVTALDADTAPAQRHVTLTIHAPYDVVVDAMPPQGRPRRVHDLVHQLRRGGALVVVDAAGALDPDGEGGKGLAGLLERVAKARQAPPGPSAPLPERDAGALAAATEPAYAAGRHLVLVSRSVGVLAKLDEPEMNLWLDQHPDPRHRLVELLPAEPFRSRCVLRESSGERGPNTPDAYHPPAMSLREYRDVVVTPGQVVSDERLLMPDTYRHNERRRLLNRFTEEVAPRFARVRGLDRLDHPGLRELAGPWFHLDNEVRGHFGHLMTETLSRMWAWPQVKERHPDARVLLGTNRRREVQPYEYDILRAGGIVPEDVVLVEEPVRVERLLSATPMLSNPQYVHPRITETWDRVGDTLAREATGLEHSPRIFCSRRLSKRACRNTDEVEEVFAAHGFAVVYPEDFGLGDQVEMFRTAEVVAGFAGSGMFQLCFARDPKRVITLSSSRYNARNEYLIASVRGHTIDAITSEPEEDDFQSPFTFDHDREGRHLARVLADL